MTCDRDAQVVPRLDAAARPRQMRAFHSSIPQLLHSSISATFRVLALCAGRPGSAELRERLRGEAAGLSDWNDLTDGAEYHGLEPLVLTQLRDAAIAVPADVEDRLRARWMQHAHAYAVRTRVVLELARALDAERIPFLLLKGAALAHLVYASPLLRPMRDVDVLVRKEDMWRARGVLERAGFSPAGAAVAPDYHHLQSMATRVDGATVTIELHYELLRATAFLNPLDYEDLRDNAQPFDWAGVQLHTLGREDMLWHVYAHAFAINVLRPEVRLISIADLVNAVEGWADTLDWDRLQRRHGRLFRALPLLHHLTPWSPNVVAKLGGRAADVHSPFRPGVCNAPFGLGPLTSSVTWTGALKADVWWPPEWSFRVRYGIDSPGSWLWYRFASHPARLLLAAANTARTRLGSRADVRSGREALRGWHWPHAATPPRAGQDPPRPSS